MKWVKSESGVVAAICANCGRYYEMNSEWDRANLEWHLCQKVGS
jgi:hypothetical protein